MPEEAAERRDEEALVAPASRAAAASGVFSIDPLWAARPAARPAVLPECGFAAFPASRRMRAAVERELRAAELPDFPAAAIPTEAAVTPALPILA